MEKSPASKQKIESAQEKRAQFKEELFQQIVATNLLDRIHEELDEQDVSPQSRDEINRTFAELSEANKRAVLAIPAELRPKVFKKYAEQMRDGKMNGADVIYDILQKARRYGFTLGYHLSPHEIKQSKDGSWAIRGTEKDHRHDDLPMAYYSMDYTHRYLKKPMKHLYIVRAETGETSSQYQDNDGSWGHATSLSVIDALDMDDIEGEMERRLSVMKDIKEKGGADSSSASL